MKTITEYLINNHVQNKSTKIESAFDLNHGDYFKVEWKTANRRGKKPLDGQLFGKFNCIDFYSKKNMNKSVIYDYCIYIGAYGQKNIEINGHCSVSNPQLQLTYKNVSKDEAKLLDELETFIHEHDFDKYIGDGDVHAIGYIDENNKFILY